MEMEHKILEYADHLSVYIAGVFTVAGAVAAFLLRDRKLIKKRIVNNEKQYEQLSWLVANSLATKTDLIKCGEDKDRQHHAGIKDVLTRLDKNADEHDEILKTMNEQHSETLNTIVKLHTK